MIKENSLNLTNYTTISACVACDSTDLYQAMDLGLQPLANDYLNIGEVFEEFPLVLNVCKKCFHGQLSIAVNPIRLFKDYPYVSGTSETMSIYFSNLAETIIKDHGTEGKLLDIGSNDGSFLAKFKDTNWNVIGVDPAENLISIAKSNGVTTIPSFFDLKISNLLTNDFDVIVAMNVFAHNNTPIEILHAINLNLKIGGTAYIQTSQANMMSNYEFDTIYHEHISFFNVRSMKELCKRVGMELLEVSIVPVHGDSYLWKIKKSDKSIKIVNYAREELEKNLGLYEMSHYEKFSQICKEKTDQVLNLIQQFRQEGYSIATYGAAAKGNTFLNFAKIEVDYIFDDTPHKIGKLAPAGGCHVSDPHDLKVISNNLLIIIPAWNFAEEITKKIRIIRSHRKDKILQYFPNIKIIDL